MSGSVWRITGLLPGRPENLILLLGLCLAMQVWGWTCQEFSGTFVLKRTETLNPEPAKLDAEPRS